MTSPAVPQPVLDAAAALKTQQVVYTAPGQTALTPEQAASLKTAISTGGDYTSNLRVVVLPASARLPGKHGTCATANQVGNTAYGTQNSQYHVAVIVGDQSCGYYGEGTYAAGDPLVKAVHALPASQRGDTNALLQKWVGVEESAHVPQSHPPTHIPWAKIGIGAGGMLGTVVLATVGVVAARTTFRRTAALAAAGQDRRSLKQAAADAAQARMDTLALLRGRHCRITEQWAAYEFDMVAVFEAPLLSDVQVPQTAAFFTAEQTAADRRAVCDRTVTAETVTAYETSVRDLETTWRTAWEHATRSGHKFMSQDEKDTVRRALGLLRKALDQSGTEVERQACYAQAMRLVKGIVVVPHKAVQAIEQATRLALPAGQPYPTGLPQQPPVRSGAPTGTPL